jgi:hypothetical protein
MADAEGAKIALELQHSLEALSGIRGARVELEGPNIETIRVLVVPERAIDDTVADVRRIAGRDHGLNVAADAIEVLRTSSSFLAPGLRRRRLASISTNRSEDRFQARVVLELNGDVLVGEDDSPSERSFELRSVAKATLDSMRELLDSQIDLESVDIVNVGNDRLSIVTLDGTGQTLVGSALVRLDDFDSVARATLDALNRWLGNHHERRDTLRVVE